MDPRIDIITTLNTLFWATDHHDWDTLAHVFSDQVTLDYGEPELLSPQEIIGRWRPVFEGLDAHQHLVSNHLITLRDDAATATASFIATHQRMESYDYGNEAGVGGRGGDRLSRYLIPTIEH